MSNFKITTENLTFTADELKVHLDQVHYVSSWDGYLLFRSLVYFLLTLVIQ